MPTEAIYHYLKVTDELITAGQPTEAHLQSAAAEGFRTVINLATINPRYSLKDEAGLVQSLGMTYHHLPVEWEHPTEKDFEDFEGLLKGLPPGKTLIHCAANFRVTAFYALYALKNLGWTEAQAEAFRALMWQGSNFPVWEKFMSEMKARLAR